MPLPQDNITESEASVLSGPHLTVRVRRLLTGNGEIMWHQSVRCPRLGHSVSTEVCKTCPACGGLDDGTVDTHPLVACTAAPEELLSAHLRPRGPGGVTVDEIMTTDVTCVMPDVTTDGLMELLLLEGFSGVPVVDEQGVPLGMVTKTDLIREHHDKTHEHDVTYVGISLSEDDSRGDRRSLHVEATLDTTVGEIMAPLTFVLTEGASVAKAAALMAYEGIHRIPIVGSGGEVVGLVAALDILSFMAGEIGYAVPGHPNRRRQIS